MRQGTIQYRLEEAPEGTNISIPTFGGGTGPWFMMIKQRKVVNGRLTAKAAWWVHGPEQDRVNPVVHTNASLARLLIDGKWVLS